MTSNCKEGVIEESVEMIPASLKLQRTAFVLLSGFNNYESICLSDIFLTTAHHV